MRPSFENVSLRERVGDAREACLACRLVGLELVGLQERDRLGDRRLASGRVEPLALRCREHDVEDGALLGGELGLDQVGRLLRIRAGNRELVAQRATDRGHEEDQGRDDRDPGQDDPPGVVGAHAHPVRERSLSPGVRAPKGAPSFRSPRAASCRAPPRLSQLLGSGERYTGRARRRSRDNRTFPRARSAAKPATG